MGQARIVLVTGSTLVPPEARLLITERGFEICSVPNDYLDAEALHDALVGASGYIIGGYEEPVAEHFERATDLEVVGWVGTDFRGYVPGWNRAFELGIAFVSTPGENVVSVAEFTVLLMLALARPFVAGIATASPPSDGPMSDGGSAGAGAELCGRTLGVIGAGRIGARVARAAALGLGMKVLYTGPRRNAPLEAAIGLEHVDMPTLLKSSDVLSLHRPGPRPDEPPTLGKAELEQIKNGAVLVNTGHVGLVDFDALAWAVEHKNVRAAFDGVGSGEAWQRLVALGPHRFLSVPQMGFSTADANIRAGVRAAEAVCDVLSGVDSPLTNNTDFRLRRASRRRP